MKSKQRPWIPAYAGMTSQKSPSQSEPPTSCLLPEMLRQQLREWRRRGALGLRQRRFERVQRARAAGADTEQQLLAADVDHDDLFAGAERERRDDAQRAVGTAGDAGHALGEPREREDQADHEDQREHSAADGTGRTLRLAERGRRADLRAGGAA